VSQITGADFRSGEIRPNLTPGNEYDITRGCNSTEANTRLSSASHSLAFIALYDAVTENSFGLQHQ